MDLIAYNERYKIAVKQRTQLLLCNVKNEKNSFFIQTKYKIYLYFANNKTVLYKFLSLSKSLFKQVIVKIFYHNHAKISTQNHSFYEMLKDQDQICHLVRVFSLLVPAWIQTTSDWTCRLKIVFSVIVPPQMKKTSQIFQMYTFHHSENKQFNRLLLTRHKDQNCNG